LFRLMESVFMRFTPPGHLRQTLATKVCDGDRRLRAAWWRVGCEASGACGELV
jgi:hypothetical protein